MQYTYVPLTWQLEKARRLTTRTLQSNNVSEVLQNGDDKSRMMEAAFWTLMVHSFGQMQYYSYSQEVED